MKVDDRLGCIYCSGDDPYVGSSFENKLTYPVQSAEQNYVELVMTIRHTQGMFALLPVRSNYSVPERDALLRRLTGDLGDIPLRIIRLTRESWNAAHLISDEAGRVERAWCDCLARAGGNPRDRARRRRENTCVHSRWRYSITVARRFGPAAPIPSSFGAIPDLSYSWQHATSSTTSQAYSPLKNRPLLISRRQETVNTRRSTEPKTAQKEPPSWLGSPVALAFYEEQLAKNQQPTPERAAGIARVGGDSRRRIAAQL